ncbi:dCTP deaminase [Candidatus Micrarchaeota archaeon]|nr:dCTP deaminase [Candidatus Micrarchaeota archaeon]
MAILSGKSIRDRIAKGDIVVRGVEEPSIGVASLDIHLGDRFTEFRYTANPVIDIKEYKNPTRYEKMLPDGRMEIRHDYTTEYVGQDPYIIYPQDPTLCTTKEYLKLPDDIIGRFYLKSTLTKIGVMFESAASWSGVLTPGFEGDFQFPIVYNGRLPVRIYPGMVIGEVFFEKIE